MLSAVENHFGPNRSYASGAHHYSGNGATGINGNPLNAPCPILPLTNPMASAEFARPHPKTNRYNGQAMRNGLPSVSRPKYSSHDQSAPVNLAQDGNGSVADALAHSRKMNDVAGLTKPSALESEQEAISNSIASLYQPKLSYCPPESTSSLYYHHQNFYSRPPTSYGPMYTPSPSSHTLGVRGSSLHHGVAASYPESYPNAYFVGATAYSPPTPAQPLLSPKQPIGSITSQNNNNTSISAQSVLSISPPSMYAQQHQQHQKHQQHQQHQQHQPHQQHPHHPQHPQHLQHAKQHQQKSREQYQAAPKTDYSSSLEQTSHMYRTEAKEKEAHGKAVDFKIPSGKEGSLKHRILTRPYDKELPPTKQTNKSMPQPNSPSNAVTKSNGVLDNIPTIKTIKTDKDRSSNFTKGTLIELSTGSLKRVEDMRTEDFLTSACENPNLELKDATVIKLALQSTKVIMITLRLNNEKIYIETEPTHPFFVYGKGWASYHPEETLLAFGLQCEMLQVGDVCISLAPKSPAIPNTAANTMTNRCHASTSPIRLPSKSITGRTSYDNGYAGHDWTRISSSSSSSNSSNNSNRSLERHESRKYPSAPMAPPPPPLVPESTNGLARDESYEAVMRTKKRRAISVPDTCDESKKSKAK